MRTRLIVNPTSDQGHTLDTLPRILQTLEQFGLDFDVVQTRSPGHAGQLAQAAAVDGIERIVAVGGDGTCNEIANGLLTWEKPVPLPILGLIPSGSGNDWAVSLNIPLDVDQACALLNNGSERVIDVGRVTVDHTSRFFVNTVGLGLDAEVAIDTRRIRWLRGFPRYLVSVFRVLLFGRWPYPVQFSYNQEQIQQPVVLLTVANGTRAGGGFLLTPDAKMDDGLFDICYAPQISRLRLMNLLPKALKGTHIYDPVVTMARSGRVEVFAQAGIPGHIDGEILCAAGRQFQFELLPDALRVWM